jgi:hypothetical protein
MHPVPHNSSPNPPHKFYLCDDIIAPITPASIRSYADTKLSTGACDDRIQAKSGVATDRTRLASENCDGTFYADGSADARLDRAGAENGSDASLGKLPVDRAGGRKVSLALGSERSGRVAGAAFGQVIGGIV